MRLSNNLERKVPPNILKRAVNMYASSGCQFFKSLTGKAYFRKTKHVCGLNKKGHILVNLRQFVHETVLNSMQI